MLRRLLYIIWNGRDLVGCLQYDLIWAKTSLKDDKLASYAYWTVMMGLITVLLFEGMCRYE